MIQPKANFFFPKMGRTPGTRPKFGTKGQAEDVFGVDSSGHTYEQRSDAAQIGIFRRAHNRGVDRQKASMIHPLNAQFIRPLMPKPGFSSFILLNGNCQGIDVLMAMIGTLPAPPTELILSSLSANMDTFDALDTIQCHKEILISSYFLATNPNNLIGKLHRQGRLKNYTIGMWRNHTKHMLIRGPGYSIFARGSANLRSSGCIESMDITNDPSLYDFNRDWMRKVIKREPVEKFIQTGQTNANGFFTFLNEK